MLSVHYDMPVEALLQPWKRLDPKTYVFKEPFVVDCLQHRIVFSESVVISGGLIASIDGSFPPDLDMKDAIFVDAKGMYLCPGLIDCHCHLNIPPGGHDLPSLINMSSTQVTLRQPQLCKDILERGFTTVRDPAGSSLALKEALAEGIFPGPRLFFAGMALSQTGGHGDLRRSHDTTPLSDDCCGRVFGNVARVVDGVPECLRWAREEIRRGADFLKIMAGGGVASPTDAITHVQFTGEEIKAITTVARGVGTYVTAHAYTPEAIRLAISNGVTCIEHGNLIDTETATYMAENNVFLTPTLATYAEMGADKWHGFLPPSLASKNKLVLDAGLNANPLEDISIFERGEQHVLAVIKGGVVELDR